MVLDFICNVIVLSSSLAKEHLLTIFITVNFSLVEVHVLRSSLLVARVLKHHIISLHYISLHYYGILQLVLHVFM